jgi:hypothetical protein
MKGNPFSNIKAEKKEKTKRKSKQWRKRETEENKEGKRYLCVHTILKRKMKIL